MWTLGLQKIRESIPEIRNSKLNARCAAAVIPRGRGSVATPAAPSSAPASFSAVRIVATKFPRRRGLHVFFHAGLVEDESPTTRGRNSRTSVDAARAERVSEERLGRRVVRFRSGAGARRSEAARLGQAEWRRRNRADPGWRRTGRQGDAPPPSRRATPLRRHPPR